MKISIKPIHLNDKSSDDKNIKTQLKKIYQTLFKHFGPQSWWPGEMPFEIIVGAILTQNTNWGNVEKAIVNLKKANALTPRALKDISQRNLAELIKPSGFFNIKSQRLKNFVEFLFAEYQGELSLMAKQPLDVLRKQLLAVNGIGPETADSILLYAFEKPIFVVDAYTKRIFYRHNLIGRDEEYHRIQQLFMRHTTTDVAMFNEYHALVVRLAKNFCRVTPNCRECPLQDINYSLEEKCHSCHRYLPKITDRYYENKNRQKIREKFYLCRHCTQTT